MFIRKCPNYFGINYDQTIDNKIRYQCSNEISVIMNRVFGLLIDTMTVLDQFND